jgi:hypothetical protein
MSCRRSGRAMKVPAVFALHASVLRSHYSERVGSAQGNLRLPLRMTQPQYRRWWKLKTIIAKERRSSSPLVITCVEVTVVATAAVIVHTKGNLSRTSRNQKGNVTPWLCGQIWMIRQFTSARLFPPQRV